MQGSNLKAPPEQPEGYFDLYATACSQLNGEIQGILDQFDGVKVMGFHWASSLGVPVAVTSWERPQRFERFDAEEAAAIVKDKCNRAPEPNAP